MASARVKLDPQATEAIARKVVELLEKHGVQKRELVDAAELAKRFGIEWSWVYSHAIELGAVKLGCGAKPRLRFDPQIAARVLRRVGEESAAGGGSGVRLLPIREQGENEPPPAA